MRVMEIVAIIVIRLAQTMMIKVLDENSFMAAEIHKSNERTVVRYIRGHFNPFLEKLTSL